MAEAPELWFVGPTDLLKGRVEPTTWARMVTAFTRIGWKVTLITPYAFRRENIRRRDVHDYYDLPKEATISVLPTPLLAKHGSVSYYRLVSGVVFTAEALIRLLKRSVTRGTRRRELVVYGKGYITYLPFFLLGRLGKHLYDIRFVFETNALTGSRYDRWLLPRVDLVVVNSSVLKRDLVELGVAEESVHVAYLAPNVPDHSTGDPERVYQELDMSGPLVVYTGKVLDKDIAMFREIADRLQEDEVHLVVVGGQARESGFDNLHFVGFVPPKRVVDYQVAAEILLNLVRSDRSIHRHITPQKIFEYLAAEKPVITTPFPALSELDPAGILVVARDDPLALANGIRSLINDPALRQDLARRARELSHRYSYEARVKGIVEALGRATESGSRRARSNACAGTGTM